jgi:hypothetical protein
MKKMNVLGAAIAGLMFAASLISSAGAAPSAGALALAVESNFISVTRRCWHGDQWVCARMYYRYDPAYYRTYGCPAYRRGHRPYDRDDGEDLSAWPYYFHDYCRPDGLPHPIGFYGGKAFYFGGVW